MAKLKVVHYINQFFAQIGGEEKADYPAELRKGEVVGPGLALMEQFGEEAEIIATIVCGDTYFNENMDSATAQVLEWVKAEAPDVFIAGPAFNAGRYGVACATVAAHVQQDLGIPSLTGMYVENPGVDMFKDKVLMVSTKNSAAGMRKAVKTMAPLALKLAKGEKFSVVVSLKSNNGKNYFLAEDSSCKYEKGQTYFYSAEKGWQDCADTIYKNAYINAYTQKDGKPDSAELKKLVEEYDGKRGMQTAIDYCKSVLKKSDAGFAEVNNAVKRINATKNECDEYTVITTAAEWNEFARNVNSGVQYRNKTVVVEADIDFEGVEFIAAGMDEDRCFNGCFQGNGYVFRNISAGDEKDNCIGVFGYIGKYSCVSGLTVSDSRFTAKTAGGIAGICQGGTVTACGFKGEIKAATSGGIVGSLEKGTLSDCWSEVSDISGIIGSSSSDGKFCVLNCFSTAKDVLENVKLADNTDKLCEMLNTNGGINKSNKRFEQSGSTVRYHAIPDNSSSIAQETKAKASVVGITAIVCLAVIICTAGIIVMLMCLKRKKR